MIVRVLMDELDRPAEERKKKKEREENLVSYSTTCVSPLHMERSRKRK